MFFRVFLTKFDRLGVKQWTRQLGSSANDNAYGATADVAGNIYVAGHLSRGFDGKNTVGFEDVFLAKFGGFP